MCRTRNRSGRHSRARGSMRSQTMERTRSSASGSPDPGAEPRSGWLEDAEAGERGRSSRDRIMPSKQSGSPRRVPVAGNAGYSQRWMGHCCPRNEVQDCRPRVHHPSAQSQGGPVGTSPLCYYTVALWWTSSCPPCGKDRCARRKQVVVVLGLRVSPGSAGSVTVPAARRHAVYSLESFLLALPLTRKLPC